MTSKSEAHKAHLGGDAVWGGADEEEPLGKEVWHEDQELAVWDRFHEHVPGEDEVGEDEEDCSEGEEAASLQKCQKHHCADETCIDCDASAEDSWVCGRGDTDKYYCQECQDAEQHHRKIAFCLDCQLSVSLDLAEVPAGKIYDVHDVREREGAYLSEETFV